MLRTRNKTTEAAYGGKECDGENSVNITCNTIDCPGNSLFQIVLVGNESVSKWIIKTVC